VRPPTTTRYVTLGTLVDVWEESVEVEGEAIISHIFTPSPGHLLPGSDQPLDRCIEYIERCLAARRGVSSRFESTLQLVTGCQHLP
jgi:hypothetical protein